MRGLRIVGIIVAILMILFGVLFVIASTSEEAQAGGQLGLWCGVGVALIVVGLAIIGFAWWQKRKEQKIEITQQIELTGDLEMEKLKCEQCGAAVDKKSISVEAGAITVHCPYCGSVYQISEEPKW